MVLDWLWDRDIPLEKVKDILKDAKSLQFAELAALLLARKNTPREVFGQYLDKEVFVRNWPRIKKRMRRDDWNNSRIVFWQAVYEKLVQDFRKQGMIIRVQQPANTENGLCQEIGRQIQDVRKQKGLTQKDVARKMGVSQQIVSRIEQGGHNTGIMTLKAIADVLGKKVTVELK